MLQMRINAPAASSRALTLVLPTTQQLHGALDDILSSERSSPETPTHLLEQRVEQVRQGLPPSKSSRDARLFHIRLFRLESKSPAPIDTASGSDASDQVAQASAPPLGLLAESPPEPPQTVSGRHLLCQRHPTLQQQGEPTTPPLQRGRNTSAVISADRGQQGQPGTSPLQALPLTPGNLLRLQIRAGLAETSADREQAKKHLNGAECLWAAYSQVPSMEKYLEALPSDRLRDRCRNTHMDHSIKLLMVIDNWHTEVEQSGPPSPIPEQKVKDRS